MPSVRCISLFSDHHPTGAVGNRLALPELSTRPWQSPRALGGRTALAPVSLEGRPSCFPRFASRHIATPPSSPLFSSFLFSSHYNVQYSLSQSLKLLSRSIHTSNQHIFILHFSAEHLQVSSPNVTSPHATVIGICVLSQSCRIALPLPGALASSVASYSTVPLPWAVTSYCKMAYSHPLLVFCQNTESA